MIRASDKRLGEILNQNFKVPNHYIDEILKKQMSFRNNGEDMAFGEVAILSKVLSQEQILQGLSIQYGLDYQSSFETLAKVDFERSLRHPYVAKLFEVTDTYEIMQLCLKNKIFIIDIDEAEKKIEVGVGSYEDFNTDILIKTIKKDFEDVRIVPLSSLFFSKAKLFYDAPTVDDLKQAVSDFSKGDNDFVPFLQMLLTFAIIRGISDIHLEPNYNDTFRVTGRKDGERELLFYMSQSHASAFLNVIKNNANMDAELKTTIQDGQISGASLLKDYRLNIKRGQEKPRFSFPEVAFRVSTYPNQMGENEGNWSFETMVIRLLNANNDLTDIENLNLSKKTLEEILFAITKRTGIIIVSGPTGSGKTTSLYALLSRVDFLKEKIITFENPVEIRNMFWTQGERKVNSNERLSFDFAQAKKSILRQDPDIILMGEIRDPESAKFALEAANTGHLVLATLHANNALAVIERLKELGVMTNDVLNALICSFAQRLAKRVCKHCGEDIYINSEDDENYKKLLKLGLKKEQLPLPLHFKEASLNGCEFCDFKGIKGRIIIDEVIPMSNQVKHIIGNTKLTQEQRDGIQALGYNSLVDNALDKAKSHIIPLSEISKVT